MKQLVTYSDHYHHKLLFTSSVKLEKLIVVPNKSLAETTFVVQFVLNIHMGT